MAALNEMRKAEGQITGSPDSLVHARGDLAVGSALFGQGILAMQHSLKSLGKEALGKQGTPYAVMADSSVIDAA